MNLPNSRNPQIPVAEKPERKQRAPELRGLSTPKKSVNTRIDEVLKNPITDPETIIQYRKFSRNLDLKLASDKLKSKQDDKPFGLSKSVPKASLTELKISKAQAEKELSHELQAIDSIVKSGRKFKSTFISKRDLFKLPQNLQTALNVNIDDLRTKTPKLVNGNPKAVHRKPKQTGHIVDINKPRVPLPKTASQNIPQGTYKVNEVARMQNITEYVVRFFNNAGWEGLYAEIENILDNYESRGAVNVKIGFMDPFGQKKFRTILQRRLISQDSFLSWVQQIFSENISGSDNVYDGGEGWEVIPDMFSFNVVQGRVEGGFFSNSILPVINFESSEGKCWEELLKAHFPLEYEVWCLHPKPTYDTLISDITTHAAGLNLTIIENKPFLKVNLTRKRVTHRDGKPRPMFTAQNENYYRLNNDELVFRRLGTKEFLTYDQLSEKTILFGSTTVGDKYEDKRLTFHVDMIKKQSSSALSNISFDGSEFSVGRNEPTEEVTGIPKAQDSENLLGTICTLNKSLGEAFNKVSYCELAVSIDLETIIEYLIGCMFKCYSASLACIPMFLLSYIEALTKPEFKHNLANLIKFRSQRIPMRDGVFTTLYRVEPTGYFEFTEAQADVEYKRKTLIKVDTDVYTNTCIDEQGYFTIRLFDKTVGKPTGKWYPGVDSPLDLMYDVCFNTRHTNTRYKFITFNGSSFDNFFIFEYGQARGALEITESEGVKFKNPLFVRGLLNMQIQEPSGLTHDFWDLAKHIPGSLAKLSKKWQVGALQKSTLNHNEVQRAYNEGRFEEFIAENIEGIQAYNSLDCLAPLAIAYKYQKELRGIKPVNDLFISLKKNVFDIMTIGSLTHKVTLRTASENRVDFKPLPFCLYEDVRSSAVAGRCDLTNGPCVIFGPIASLDIKSAYPYVCAVGPYYFPHGAITFKNHINYDKLPVKERTRTSYDDGRPMGFFYGEVNWEGLKVNPGLAMKTKEGNDWKIQKFITWVSTEFIYHLKQKGAKFTPLPLSEEQRKQICDDYYEINGEMPDLPTTCHGFTFAKKCRGVKIFEHILEFMKIKNGQDKLKDTVNSLEDYVKECYTRDTGDNLKDMEMGVKQYLTNDESEEYKYAKTNYNQSLRETCKLMSNAATGKPMEDIHTDKFKFLEHTKDFWKYKALEEAGKVTDVVADKIHEGGIIIHYKTDKKASQLSQNPFYITSMIYDYTRIKLFNETYETLPSVDCGIYSDTDSTKMRNFINPKTKVNDLEYALAKLSKMPLPYCPEALKYDPRLEDAMLTSPNIYGTYEDEFPDKVRAVGEEQAFTVFYQKKFNVTIGVKGNIISATAKGVNMGRDVYIPEINVWRYLDIFGNPNTEPILPHHWIVEQQKRSRDGKVKIIGCMNKSLTQPMLHAHMMEQQDKGLTMKHADSLNGLIQSAEKYRSVYIFTAPFTKHIKNASRSATIDTPDKMDSLNLAITSSVSVKKLQLERFSIGN